MVTPAALQAKADQAARLARRKELLEGMRRAAIAAKSAMGAIKADLGAFGQELPTIGPAINGAVSTFIAGRANETIHLTTALKKEMALRRQLFNQIQELKGNIRVYCTSRGLACAIASHIASRPAALHCTALHDARFALVCMSMPF